MIIKNIEVEKFRSISEISFDLGKKLTAIAGRNATQKTTLLGMLGQPFSISKSSPLRTGLRSVTIMNLSGAINGL